VSFGDHLGSHQETHFSLAKLIQDLRVGFFAGSGVTVQAGHLDLGQSLLNFLFQALGTQAEEEELNGGALRTTGHGRNSKAAIMAMKGPIGKVVMQRYAAVGALVNKTAIPAEGESRKTPPVQKKNGLLSACAVPAHGFFQRPRED
jgi:hypothetical protein